MDENFIYREATKRICSTLKVEKALWNCFIYIKEMIPVDQLFLTYYDAKSEEIKVHATATIEGGRRLSTFNCSCSMHLYFF